MKQLPQFHAKTHLGTLYRLRGVGSELDHAFDLFDPSELDERQAQIEWCRLGDVDAIFVHADFKHDRASWCDDAQITTGLCIQHPEHRSGAVLLFAVDEAVYAMGYGQGHLLIPDDAKDQRFGLSFVARRIDERQVRQLVRRRPGAGRVDSTHIPEGAPLWMVGLDAGAEIVRRLGGQAPAVAFTYAGRERRVLHLEGGAGLRTRFGLAGADLIADVREIDRVLREEDPAPGLEVIDFLVPVTDRLLLLDLEADLDERLGGLDADGIVLVPPSDRLRPWAQARAFTYRVGSVACEADEVTVDDIVRRASLQKNTRRVHELKRGRIEMFADARRRERTANVSVFKCLEVSATRGSRRFFLMEGHWYELDAAHLAAQRAQIAGLFRDTPSLDLPAWDRSRHADERAYNEWLPGERPGYIKLDRELVRNAMASHGSIEVCDHLAPDDTLVLVKRGSGSRELSHLFAQASVAAKTLFASSTARADFAALVGRLGRGRTLAPDFVPKRMVLAILHERGLALRPESMLPFSVTALAQTAALLAAYGVELEVIGIAPADKRDQARS